MYSASDAVQVVLALRSSLQVGAGVGVVAASLALRGLRPPATPASYLGCLSLGVTGGVLAHVLTTSREQPE